MRVHRAIFFLNDEEQLTSDVLWPHAEQRNRKGVAASRAQANKARNLSRSPPIPVPPTSRTSASTCIGEVIASKQASLLLVDIADTLIEQNRRKTRDTEGGRLTNRCSQRGMAVSVPLRGSRL